MAENQKTFKYHVSRVLAVPVGKVEQLWREAREKGLIKTGARGVHAHVPNDRERRAFLRYIAMRKMGGEAYQMHWNGPGSFETEGVVVEKFGGISKRVEIPAACVRSILAFGGGISD